jgi:hypothetical protein
MKWWLIALGILLVLVLLGRPRVGRDVLTTTVSGPATLAQPRAAVVRAVRKASAYWGGTRCWHITYAYRPLADARIAQAEWYSSGLASRRYFKCSVTFDAQRIRTSFALYCAAVVHEFGHLSGHPHARDPRNIMYPRLSARNIPPTCKDPG